jgi:hypothetical protein
MRDLYASRAPNDTSIKSRIPGFQCENEKKQKHVFCERLFYEC